MRVKTPHNLSEIDSLKTIVYWGYEAVYTRLAEIGCALERL